MRTAVLVLTAIAAAGITAAAQGTQESPNRTLTVEIAARGYLEGGRAGSLAGDSGADRIDSYVWADQSLCGLGAGDEVPSGTPWVGWHFTGNVTSRTANELVVDVRWQKLWEGGRRLSNSPNENRTLRIRSGERVELDRVLPANVGRCGTLEARLEAAVMGRAAYLMGVAGGVAAGVRGGGRGGVASATTGTRGGRGTAGGGVGGTAAGVAGGSPATSAQGNAATTVQGGRGGRAGGGTTRITTGTMSNSGAGRGSGSGSGSGTSGSTTATIGRGGRGGGVGTAQATDAARAYSAMAQSLRNSLSNSYEGEVWLVHKQPNGQEIVQRQVLRFGTASTEFAFPPIEVAGSGGAITVDISGSLRYGMRPAGFTGRGFASAGRGSATAGRGGRASTEPATESIPRFTVSIARRARRASPFIDTRGATDIAVELPKSDDVLSFELPPLQKSTEDLLRGHTFSIRLRVTPIK